MLKNIQVEKEGMYMGILKKLLVSVVILSLIFTFIPSSILEVNATDTVSGLVGGLNGKLPSASLSSGLQTFIKRLLGLLQIASGILSVIVIAFTGFNYVMAATPDMKEEVKKKMLPMVIGIVLLFSASSIAKFIIGAIEGATLTTNQ